MLIVNADDLGRSKAATDTALACYAQKRISSTSAMVFMADSERAAELALSAGIDVGMHINLSEQFSANSVPPQLRDYHGEVCRFLTLNKYALVLFNPFLAKNFQYVFKAQYTEFLRLYGRPPSHLDGHQHMHLATNMLIQRILPCGFKVRRSFSFQAGEKNFINRCYRNVVDKYVVHRHRTTDYFFSIAHYLDSDRLEYVINLAQEKNVELMVHPELQKEYNFLMSDQCSKALSKVHFVSYREL
jgi:chitin disaccharide deacetylase